MEKAKSVLRRAAALLAALCLAASMTLPVYAEGAEAADTTAIAVQDDTIETPTPEENTTEPQDAETTPTPEPTAVPQFDGLSVQPTTIYNEGEQPSYTVTPDNNLNMRSGPSTDYDLLAKIPASTGVTALGANEDGSWVVVNYNGQYGWLKAEFLNG